MLVMITGLRFITQESRCHFALTFDVIRADVLQQADKDETEKY